MIRTVFSVCAQQNLRSMLPFPACAASLPPGLFLHDLLPTPTPTALKAHLTVALVCSFMICPHSLKAHLTIA